MKSKVCQKNAAETPKKCRLCNSPYSVSEKTPKTRQSRYCSLSCVAQQRVKLRIPVRWEKRCAGCGKMMIYTSSRWPSQVNVSEPSDWVKRKHCSKNCSAIGWHMGDYSNPKKCLEAFFHKHVDQSQSPNDCWLWRGKINQSGYGAGIRLSRTTITAHRLAYGLYKGPIPRGHVVRHVCDNPPCVNPAHLLTGTVLQNVEDRQIRGRQAKGAKNYKAQRRLKDYPAIVQALKKGLKVSEIAKTIGCSEHLVYRLKDQSHWYHQQGGL